MDSTKKTCAHCGETKRTLDFDRSRTTDDGRCEYCRVCKKAIREQREQEQAERKARREQERQAEQAERRKHREQVEAERRERNAQRYFALLEEKARRAAERRERREQAAQAKQSQRPVGRPRKHKSEQEQKEAARRQAEYARLRHYGMTREDFAAMWDRQNGQCAICQQPLQRKSREAHIDHCHKTGKVRGILCRHCNHGLGFFKDDVARLKTAVRYVQERGFHG